MDPAGGAQVTIDAGPEGDGMRGCWLSLPQGYDPAVPHKVVVGYPGTDWVGEQIQPYLDLEADAKGDEIFVYPDPLWRARTRPPISGSASPESASRTRAARAPSATVSTAPRQGTSGQTTSPP